MKSFLVRAHNYQVSTHHRRHHQLYFVLDLSSITSITKWTSLETKCLWLRRPNDSLTSRKRFFLKFFFFYCHYLIPCPLCESFEPWKTLCKSGPKIIHEIPSLHFSFLDCDYSFTKIVQHNAGQLSLDSNCSHNRMFQYCSFRVKLSSSLWYGARHWKFIQKPLQKRYLRLYSTKWITCRLPFTQPTS
jgi:hypothetical protein